MNSNWIWAILFVLLASLVVAVRLVPKQAKSYVVLPKSSTTVIDSDFVINCPDSCKSRLRFEGSKMIITCICPQDAGLE